jgi:aminopeptidase N
VDPRTAGPIAEPDELFGQVSYDGGALALHALRRSVGDDAFFDGLRRWVVEHLDSTASTDDFRRTMEEASGRDLQAFFDAWIYAEDRPDRLPVGPIDA